MRFYSLDGDSNRVGRDTRTSQNGTCAWTDRYLASSSSWAGTYDTALRITSGQLNASPAQAHAYDTLGRTTSVPAVDTASGKALAVAYNPGDRVASVTPAGGAATSYGYDALERTSSTTTGSSMTQMHYADSSDSPAWTSTRAAWTVLAAGIDGRLAITATSTTGTTAAATAELQVTDLHGDTVATAAVPATGTITALDAATTAYDEFGATIIGTTNQGAYGWLAAQRRSTSGDVVLMGARLYNPATGRFLQVDPVPGGSAGPYLYPTDPILGYDLDGKKWRSKAAKYWRAVKGFLDRNQTDIANAGSVVVCIMAAEYCLFASVVALGIGYHAEGHRPSARRGLVDAGMLLVGHGGDRFLEKAFEETPAVYRPGKWARRGWSIVTNIPHIIYGTWHFNRDF